ncbi:MAG TPA: tellurite resistance/C4-dicarboxylate transporter family protein [Trebonia sp.]
MTRRAGNGWRHLRGFLTADPGDGGPRVAGEAAAGGRHPRSPTRSSGRAAAIVQGLSPGYFPFVMATSIISTGMLVLGPLWLSRALLVVAAAGFAVLSVAVLTQLLFFRPRVVAAFHDSERIFGYFAIAAGINVLGVRLAAAGHPLVTAILAAVAAAVWLVLTYAIPASLLVARTHVSAVGDVNGTWLLWVVATQSLSLVASTLVTAWPSQSALLAPVAVGLWSIGLLLYLLLVSLILLHWLTEPMTPQTLTPPYWILMGATAIIVLAGARILGLSATLPVVRAASGFVEGFSFALWAFGTWWVPLLVVLGIWRHLRSRWPLTYEPSLWSVVFPLGMYSVATLTFGKVAHLAFMEPLSRFMIWVALAAWLAVAAAFAVRVQARGRTGRPASDVHGRDGTVPGRA